MIAWWLVPTAACITLVLTGFWRRYAMARSLVDIPNARSSHRVPTPRGGGIAIVFAFLVCLPVLRAGGALTAPAFWSLLGACSLVALIGLFDDHTPVAPRWRLLVHFLAAGWVFALVGGLPPLSVNGMTLNLGWPGHLLMMVYLVWLLNLYNFMDGIDGLACLEAVSVSLGGALVHALAVPGGEGWMAPVLLLSAVVGFLVWNFPRARIFMGDAGSGFLGLTFGVMSIMDGWTAPELFWSWMILLGIFIVDATITILRRFVRGERVSEPHHSHAYQYAARKYGSHRIVAVVVLLINIIWLLPMAAMVATGLLDGWIGVLVAYLPLVGLAYYLKAGARELQ
jgi:Fuc2NAc and GlcNAc transferase